MTRFAWLQFRGQAILALGALLTLALVMVLTGPHLAHLYDVSLASCRPSTDCSSTLATFLRRDHGLLTGLDALIVVTPAILGAFWGAPLVASELEAGTFRLAWTQSVTRTRWLGAKFAVTGAATVLAVGLLSLAITWWASPLDAADMKRYAVFSQRDLAPVGYAVFSLVLGVTAGIVVRRTLPAMVWTGACFVAVRVVTASWLRPLFRTPVHRDLVLDPSSTGYGSSVSGLSGLLSLVSGAPSSSLQPETPNLPNSWIYSTRIVDSAGHGLTARVLKADCPGIGEDRPRLGSGLSHSHAPDAVRKVMQDCVAKVGASFHERVTYQPAGRYWSLQCYELAFFLGASVLLCALCLWWIRHRLA